MMLKGLLRRDDKGIGAVEFALVAPVLISFIIGVSQLGRMFYANADMKNAVAAGARIASVYPVPEDDAILDAIDERLLRTGAEGRSTTNIAHGTDANGNTYLELSMTYSVPLEFIFFSTPPVTLQDSRRVFTQVATPNGTTYTGTTSTSTSATSAGGTTSSTSTSTSSTSTGSTTSSTTSSSNGGGSSSSNGHAHGKCRRC